MAIGQDPSPAWVAFAAEAKRRRANAEAARARPHGDDNVEVADTRGDRRPGRTSRILTRMRRALGR
jgi:hypothetical protein